MASAAVSVPPSTPWRMRSSASRRWPMIPLVRVQLRRSRRPRPVAGRLVQIPVELTGRDPAVDRPPVDAQLPGDRSLRESLVQVVSQQHVDLQSDRARLPREGEAQVAGSGDCSCSRYGTRPVDQRRGGTFRPPELGNFQSPVTLATQSRRWPGTVDLKASTAHVPRGALSRWPGSSRRSPDAGPRPSRAAHARHAARHRYAPSRTRSGRARRPRSSWTTVPTSSMRARASYGVPLFEGPDRVIVIERPAGCREKIQTRGSGSDRR